VSQYIVAQETILNGVVTDSLQKPLAFSTVLARPLDSLNTVKYAMTNDAGFYTLTLRQHAKYIVTVRFMGFKTQVLQYNAVSNSTKNFILHEDATMLEEVILKLPSIVTVKNDTTTYKTKNFVTGEERKLKDVLKKLPGVEVKKNGAVIFQGKKVTKLLVEGNDFFNGGTKMGVENIPSDAIEKIQMLDNYNDVSFLKNLSDTDNVAMNILLKENKKHFFFGDVALGKGNEDFYKAKAALFYYSPKTGLNLIANSNNIGDETLTLRDYISFQGGVNAVFSGDVDFESIDLQQFVGNRDFINNKQHFSALNITKTKTKKWKKSSYLIYSKAIKNSLEQSINNYISFDESKNTLIDLDNQFAILNFKLINTPNNHSKISFKTQVKLADNIKKNSINSSIATTQKLINTAYNTSSFTFNQNIEWHKKQNEKHTFSALLKYRYKQEDPNTLWQTNTTILQSLIPIDTNQNTLRLKQKTNTTNQKLQGIFKHYWVLNRLNHIYTTFGITYKHALFASLDQQIFDNGYLLDFNTAGFNNTNRYDWLDNYIDLQYKVKKGIFTIKPSLALHHYSWKTQQDATKKTNKTVLLPSLMLKVKFLSSKTINFNYGLKTNFTTVRNLSNRYYLSSYYSVSRGDETLSNGLYHSMNLRYRSSSVYYDLDLSANLTYTKRIQGFRPTVVLNGLDQYLTTQLISNPSDNMMFRGYIHKKIKQIRYKFNTNIITSHFLQEVNHETQQNSSEKYTLKFALQSLKKDWPSIELGYKHTFLYYTSSGNKSKTNIKIPYLTLEYDFAKNYFLSLDYQYYNYSSAFSQSQYQIANILLEYQQEKSPWKFNIQLKNAFDMKYKQQTIFSNFLISDTSTYVLPRVILLTVGYKL
jgi:hypothetical protein